MAESVSYLPGHVAIIMDGNGRWAKKRLMPRSFGHNAGMKAMIELVAHAAKLGIGHITVYALSTENVASRPKDELEGLYNLIRKYFTDHVKQLYAQGARVRVIGDTASLPDDVQKLLKTGESNSPKNAKFTLAFAINYGSRAELVHAFSEIAKRGDGISEESVKNALYTADLPDPDLIIRTGGEVRLSNFLLWQAAYAELYFTDVLFPDFTPAEFDKAIAEYSKRTRRFGGV